MATHVKTIRTITDDLTGAKDATEVRFGLDGKNYTIDLTPGNRRSLEKVLNRYIVAAREVTGKDMRVGNFQVREWAKDQGYAIGDKGRISSFILDAYTKANPATEFTEDDDQAEQLV